MNKLELLIHQEKRKRFLQEILLSAVIYGIGVPWLVVASAVNKTKDLFR